MIQRVIQLAVRGGRGVTSERDQLRATIDQSLDDSDLRQLFDDFPEMAEALAMKNLLSGIPPVATKFQARLVDQVSERMYALRCRIVHSKDTGGNRLSSPYCPTVRMLTGLLTISTSLNSSARKSLSLAVVNATCSRGLPIDTFSQYFCDT